MQELRKQIDEIDEKILKLYRERMEVSKAIGEYKKKNNTAVCDKLREKVVLDRAEEYGARELYEVILKKSKEVQ